jgi:alpha-glucuronidase
LHEKLFFKNMFNKTKAFLITLSFILLIFDALKAEDGSSLWLRYKPLPETLQNDYKSVFQSLVISEKGEVYNAAANEFEMAFGGLTGGKLPKVSRIGNGALILGTASNRLVRQLVSKADIESCGNEGFIIRTGENRGSRYTMIAAKTEAGVLYGAFTLIRFMQAGEPVTQLNISEKPKYELRLLNHWDNLNGTVERGYAGHSIWWEMPGDDETLKELYTTYARANASIGINGTSINNVNASPQVLTPEYISRFANFAGYLRPYNMKIYMSINFSSPRIIGGLPTSDPLDPAVKQWWKDKVQEIYREIPDFGGFLVKANSEGQPGPQDYGRTHADGANMLAEALEPYNGVVMWRAFVYEPTGDDRAKQAYSEFMPFDGKFHRNVIVQVKNGPVDFQPREPFSPLFGAMQKSSVMIEFQITQEYLGFSNHLAYLAPMQEEVFDADTYAKGEGSTVAKATDGTLFPFHRTAIAGVANIGRDVNWTGHHFGQANWYAFGRLAWNHELTSEDIGKEWLKLNFSHDNDFLKNSLDIMMRSREAVVSYMTPFGLHHLMGWDHHHGPEPWTDIPRARPDWLPRYYHKASTDGIGFNRSSTGSNATTQYFSPLREKFDAPQTSPENMILWFHHLPWDYKMISGRTLWDELSHEYTRGVNEARDFQRIWDSLEGKIDDERFKHIQYKLKVQAREALWWRDACLLYFQTYSQRPIPLELERPVHDLEELKKIKFDMKHHN